MDFAIVAAAEPIFLRAYARERGWHNLRMLSAGESSFKYDLGGENQDGGQDSSLNVFTKNADGTVRHFYTQHPRLAQDINERGIDLLTPVFNLMDITPLRPRQLVPEAWVRNQNPRPVNVDCARPPARLEMSGCVS